MKSCAEAATRIPFRNYGKGFFICAALITITLFAYMLHLTYYDVDEGNPIEDEHRIRQVLERASMPNRTVILTILNEAWANEGTIINMFRESFWIGNGTQRLLQHLIFVCVDDKAYERCLVIHPHCIIIKTPGVNLSQEQLWLSRNYINLMWRRITFLKTVLEMNFNFVFTDLDVLWFRDPFPLLQNDMEVDIQVSSDKFNKLPWDIHNKPNAGFMYVRANIKTVQLFKYWYKQRKRASNHATQWIFNIMKFDKKFQKLGVNILFLDPQLFGGFCTIEHSDMTKSITMHATCCKGLEAKAIDLSKVLERWKKWQQLHLLQKTYTNFSNSEESFNNQSSTPPCISQGIIMSPQFDAPSACKQSFRSRFKYSKSHTWFY